MIGGAVCPNGARTDLWEPREGNDPGPPGTALTVGAALPGLVLHEPSATASLYTAALDPPRWSFCAISVTVAFTSRLARSWVRRTLSIGGSFRRWLVSNSFDEGSPLQSHANRPACRSSVTDPGPIDGRARR